MHAGALGDWVLIWPLLRALGRGGAQVVVVSHDEKAKLAAKWVACEPGSLIALPGGIDQTRLSRWWAGPEPLRGEAASHNWRVPMPDRIITFLCDDSTPAGRAWLDAAAAEFPCAQIEYASAPGSASRDALWLRENVEHLGRVPPRHHRAGPIICHIGAGSREKRWPLDNWAELIAAMRTDGHDVHVLAGEVERERLSAAETANFVKLDGRWVDSLDDLAAITAAARLFVGGDTGPTHLAAQLGIPTLALFGPTDPGLWSPVGPTVRVLAPPSPRPMDWLSPEQVHTAATLLAAYTSPQ